MTFSTSTLALLCAASFVAGLVDAIAGGGGLITVPILLSVGLPPQLALGTNKGQSVFGSFAALIRYLRAGLVERRRAPLTFVAGFVGSLVGACCLLIVKPDLLRPIVLVLLVFAGAVVTFRRPPPATALRVRAARALPLAGAIALVLGAYDGFFGPGVGTFLILSFLWLGGTLPQATADAKAVNFASNLAAVALFAYRGVVLWSVALPMAAAQLVGGFTGAHLAVKGGDRLIRPVVLGVVIALVFKQAVDLLRSL